MVEPRIFVNTFDGVATLDNVDQEALNRSDLSYFANFADLDRDCHFSGSF
jgi:hypothetical protein